MNLDAVDSQALAVDVYTLCGIDPLRRVDGSEHHEEVWIDMMCIDHGQCQDRDRAREVHQRADLHHTLRVRPVHHGGEAGEIALVHQDEGDGVQAILVIGAGAPAVQDTAGDDRKRHASPCKMDGSLDAFSFRSSAAIEFVHFPSFGWH